MRITWKKVAFALLIFVSLLTFWFVADNYFALRQPGFVVLLYHKIAAARASRDKYTLSAERFAKELEYYRCFEGARTTATKSQLPTLCPRSSLTSFPFQTTATLPVPEMVVTFGPSLVGPAKERLGTTAKPTSNAKRLLRRSFHLIGSIMDRS